MVRTAFSTPKIKKVVTLELHTSIEHEIDILPTTIDGDDGSNKSKASTSESESCKRASFSARNGR